MKCSWLVLCQTGASHFFIFKYEDSRLNLRCSKHNRSWFWLRQEQFVSAVDSAFTAFSFPPSCCVQWRLHLSCVRADMIQQSLLGSLWMLCCLHLWQTDTISDDGQSRISAQMLCSPMWPVSHTKHLKRNICEDVRYIWIIWRQALCYFLDLQVKRQLHGRKKRSAWNPKFVELIKFCRSSLESPHQ